MRKKVYLAGIVAAMAVAVTACSISGETKETETQETGSQEQAEISGDISSEEDAAEEEEKKEDGDSENAYKGTRLVTVEDISRYLTLGEYKGIALERTVQEVTDTDVDVRIQTELENNRVEVGSGGTVQEGDLVTIDFVGTKDGKAFDGGTANNYDMVIGQAGMIEGFEDGIIGMKKGETRNLPLTFPEGYFEPSLAGQDVNFQITLQNFRRAPELTEKWVKKNTDFSTLEEYRESIRKTLEEEAAENAETEMIGNAWNMVWSASQVTEYPQKDIDNFMNQYKQICEMYAAQAGMDLEQFIEAQGYTEENFEKDCRQYAEYVVKQNMVVQAIMDAEGISLNDPECLEIQERVIKENGASDLADLIDTYGQESVDQTIGLVRVENFIVENAEITDLVANGDVVGVNENAAGEENAAQEGGADEESGSEEEPVVEDSGEEEAAE